MVQENGYNFYIDKGITETNEGKFEEALDSLDHAIALDPKRPLAYFSKGVVFQHLNDLESAYDNYSAAIDYDSRMTDAYYNRAQVLLADKEADTEKLKSAYQDLNKAIDLDPKFVDALYYKAVLQKKFEDYKGSLETLDKVLAIEPNAVYSRALKKLILQKYLK